MSRSLVTGGAGFLGSNLIERLLSSGDEVICVDNFFTGRRANLPEHHPKLTVLEHDVIAPLSSDTLGPLDRIFHLACPASPPAYQKDPIFTLRTTFEGTRNVLELARQHRARVLYASTSEIYGDPLVHPQTETYRGNVNTLGIRACYDEGKRIGETLCMEYHRLFGVEVRIVRIFNTYGPRMDPRDGRVISNFCTQALRGEPFTIYGSGKQTRSFCYVDDLVDGFLAMMTKDGISGPINLGNPNERSMHDTAEIIARLLGVPLRIEHRPLPQDDPEQRRPDISLAQSALGWSPRVDLDTGLIKTLDYFRKALAQTKSSA